MAADFRKKLRQRALRATRVAAVSVVAAAADSSRPEPRREVDDAQPQTRNVDANVVDVEESVRKQKVVGKAAKERVVLNVVKRVTFLDVLNEREKKKLFDFRKKNCQICAPKTMRSRFLLRWTSYRVFLSKNIWPIDIWLTGVWPTGV